MFYKVWTVALTSCPKFLPSGAKSKVDGNDVSLEVDDCHAADVNLAISVHHVSLVGVTEAGSALRWRNKP